MKNGEPGAVKEYPLEEIQRYAITIYNEFSWALNDDGQLLWTLKFFLGQAKANYDRERAEFERRLPNSDFDLFVAAQEYMLDNLSTVRTLAAETATVLPLSKKLTELKETARRVVGGLPDGLPNGGSDLAPEEVDGILSILEERFHEPKGMRLHKGIDWETVKFFLYGDRRALWSLAQMEKAGHEPDLYHEDDEYYYFGTCSLPSPYSARECVYDNESTPKYGPSSESGKNAVDESEAMGVELMPIDHYVILQTSEMDFDHNGDHVMPSSSYLQTPDEVRKKCRAVLGFRCDDGPHRMEIDVGTISSKVGWRGYVKVRKKAA
jgi:hypothetical protein